MVRMQLSFFQTLIQKRKPIQDEQQWLDSLHVDILRRPWQRSISMRVRPSGLVRVTCSKTCKITEIQKFLLSNKDWVEKSQKEFEELRLRYPKKSFVPGETFLYRGRQIPLVMENIKSTKKPKFYIMDDQLIFTHDLEKYSWEELKNWLRDAYKKSGKAHLGSMVRDVSRQMELYPKAVSYRSQKTRWGSCSSEGKVSLNWKLEAVPPEVARYVVVHELAHLKFQDHSQRFWHLVRHHCPDYRDLKKWLSDHQYEVDFLARKSDLHL